MTETARKAPAQTKRAVGQRLRKAGEALQLDKRQERAKRCGIPMATLRDYESGRRAIGSQALIQICKGYGADANWLLGVRR